MSAVGIGGAFARIATIERRVGSLIPSTLPDFGEILDQATRATPEPASTVQSMARPMMLGELIGGSMTTMPLGGAIRAALSPDGDSWSAKLPEAGRQYVAAITDAANQAGIDPALLAALVWTESDFQPDAVSPSGAVGLGQLMPATAAGLDVDPSDPIANLGGAARFLSSQIQRFGSIELGLAAYNAGPGRVLESGGIPDIPETLAYVPKVLERLRLLGGTP